MIIVIAIDINNIVNNRNLITYNIHAYIIIYAGRNEMLETTNRTVQSSHLLHLVISQQVIVNSRRPHSNNAYYLLLRNSDSG